MFTYKVPWYIGPAPVEPWPDEAPEDWPEDQEWPPPPVVPAQLSQPGSLNKSGEIVWVPLPGGLRTQSFNISQKSGVITSDKKVSISGWEEV